MSQPERREPARRAVLVVDDERAMAETIADGLADRGYDATSRRLERRGAPSASATEPFDALVTDLRMPGVDGLALLAEVAPRSRRSARSS